VSALFTGQLCDRFGHLHLMRLAGFLWCLGCLGTYFSPENVYIVLCKLGKGFGLGMASVAVPLYVFDVLVAPYRQLAIGWAAAFSIFGQAAMYAFGILLRTTLGSAVDAFHYSWIAEVFWGVLLVGPSLFLPDSPKFLARKGQWERATASLERLSLQKNLSLTSVPLQPSTFGDLFRRENRKRFFFAVALQAMAHGACVFGATHFIHYTLAFCRLDTALVETLYGVFFAIQLLFTALSVFVMKNSRRKDMLAYGFFLLTVAFSSLGATSYVYATGSTNYFVYAPVVQVSLVAASTVLALVGFAFSVASLLITSLSLLCTLETLPCDLRAKGVSIAMSTAWTVETLAATLSIGLTHIAPFALFFGLAVVSVAAIVVTLYVYE
ncbi:MFS general substrate transporter, partial [Metschnikowia bicuspidata var. bicuspidata NRRL YB-4993]